MATTYTIDELKDLVLTQVNRLPGITEFESDDVDKAYDAAMRDLGWEYPATNDLNLRIKYKWIINRMFRWFADLLRFINTPVFDQSDLKASQAYDHWEGLVAKYDAEFESAKVGELSGVIELTDISGQFGQTMVIDPGFKDDMLGEDITERTK